MKEVETIAIQPALLHQAVIAEAANLRAAHGHTKTRGMVRGGGRKPWRQKGTGRARHGSIRSPIWVGGGITFGPSPARNFSKALPQTMRRRAFAMAVAAQLKAGAVKVVSGLTDEQAKTKALATLLAQTPNLNRPILILMTEPRSNLILASRNLSFVSIGLVSSVKTSALLRAGSIVSDQPTLAALLARALGRAVSLEEGKTKPPARTKTKRTTKKTKPTKAAE